ncbi:MAG: mevalonate kinase [Candidatus Altiarchaeales archaeon ex4484_96]|nr:MAG: mevalonate kinase [Candidatus Altiarchaeales archaeon ex4484_96]
MGVKASAPGKVILLGEHAAVYGNPVLAATVDLRTYVSVDERADESFILNNESTNVFNERFTLKDIPELKKRWETVLLAEAVEKILDYHGVKRGLEIDVKSKAPISSGLGSSASVSSAMVYAVSRELGFDISLEDTAKLAWDIENIVHGKSSGVDPYCVTYGGLLRYSKGVVSRIPLDEKPEITIGDTGVRSDTREVVLDVMRLKEQLPLFFEQYLKMMVDLVDYGQFFLNEGDVKSFGQVMNVNHGLLSSIGVSSPQLDALVWAAREAGSPGSKLCGAGRGGIMIALGQYSKEIENAGGKVLSTRLCDEGVKLESRD